MTFGDLRELICRKPRIETLERMPCLKAGSVKLRQRGAKLAKKLLTTRNCHLELVMFVLVWVKVVPSTGRHLCYTVA